MKLCKISWSGACAGVVGMCATGVVHGTRCGDVCRRQCGTKYRDFFARGSGAVELPRQLLVDVLRGLGELVSRVPELLAQLAVGLLEFEDAVFARAGLVNVVEARIAEGFAAERLGEPSVELGEPQGQPAVAFALVLDGRLERGGGEVAGCRVRDGGVATAASTAACRSGWR